MQLYAFAVSLVAAAVLFATAFATLPTSSSSASGYDPGPRFGAILAAYGLMFLLLAPVQLPISSSGARRLRDAGYSPWLMLLGLVPLGGYVVLVLTIMPTKPDPSWAPWQRATYGYGPQAALPGRSGQPGGYAQPGADGPGGYAQPGGQPAAYGQPGGYAYDPYAQPPSHQPPADDRGHP